MTGHAMFQVLLAHAYMAEIGWLGWQDASGTQKGENLAHNAQRVSARMLSYIPYADLV